MLKGKDGATKKRKVQFIEAKDKPAQDDEHKRFQPEEKHFLKVGPKVASSKAAKSEDCQLVVLQVPIELDVSELDGKLKLFKRKGKFDGKLKTETGQKFHILEENASYAKQLYSIVPNDKQGVGLRPVDTFLTLTTHTGET